MDLTNNNVGIGSKPALIVVDMINGFTDPACDLGHECPEVVSANQKLLAAFRQQQLPVFFTTVVYTDELQAGVFRRKLPALNVLTPDSQWVKIDDAMQRQSNEVLIEKQWASAFHGTDLDRRLQGLRVDSLVVSGLTTSGCVRATAVDGLQYNYPVTVVEDAVGDRNQNAHAANLFDLQAKYTDVRKCDEVVVALAQCN